MDMQIQDVIPLVIMGLVAAARSAGYPVKFAGLLGVALGLLAGLFVLPAVGVAPLSRSIITGMYMGLAAVGLVSGVKNAFEGLTRDDE